MAQQQPDDGGDHGDGDDRRDEEARHGVGDLGDGGLVAAASLTIRMICARVVSSPTRVASHRRKPDWLVVAAETLSPSALSTGMLSPVSALSFTALLPSSTMPSTGMFSPGRTTKTSPLRTSAMGTLTSVPPRRMGWPFWGPDSSGS